MRSNPVIKWIQRIKEGKREFQIYILKKYYHHRAILTLPLYRNKNNNSEKLILSRLPCLGNMIKGDLTEHQLASYSDTTFYIPLQVKC